MPRARTQSGSAICAETVSELATVIQAMPAKHHRRHRDVDVGREGHDQRGRPTAAPVPARTSALQRHAACGCAACDSAATIAPAPIEASSTVKVPAAPPGRAARHQRQQRQQRGGMQEEQGDAQQHRAHAAATARRTARRRACALARRSRPERAFLVLAPPAHDRRSPPRRDSTRVQHEDPGAAGAGDDRAGHQRADDARAVHRHAVERQRLRQLRPRHHLGDDGGEHRPAHRQARRRWRRSAPAAAARVIHAGITATHSTIATAATQNCVTMK